MKLVTYVVDGDPDSQARTGVLSGDEAQIVDLQRACQAVLGAPSPHFATMIDFLAGQAEARDLAASVAAAAPPETMVDRHSVRLLAPVPRPLTLRDCACFEEHFANGVKIIMAKRGVAPGALDPNTLKPAKDWYLEPRFYKCNVNSVVGDGAVVTYPEGEQTKDYELELAFYICKEGRDISYRDAMDYVGGYTIFNDLSARDTQLHEMDATLNLGPGLGKDFGNPMGPCLVTPDAFDPENAEMTVRVNGERRGGGNHGTAHHKIADIIAYISQNTTLYPGDAIATGTVGTGSGFEIDRTLRVGDVIELEIENIGTLTTTVGAPPPGKKKNTKRMFRRLVVGPTDAGSSVVINDFPDMWKSPGGDNPPTLDVWRVNEMPATESATAKVDMGNLPVEHEPVAGSGQLIMRHASANFPAVMPALSTMPQAAREALMENMLEMHKVIGTKHLPTEADLEKHLTMHRTETLNLFFLTRGSLIALNEQGEDIELQPGDALIQLAGMHGWRSAGTISGLLVAADMTTFTQLATKPVPTLTSSARRFRRYVTGTMQVDGVPNGRSDTVIDDYSPNEADLYDADGRHVGYAGEMWKTFAPNADVSGSADPITGPMSPTPPTNGITFRMVDLLPGCCLELDPALLSIVSTVTGPLDVVTDTSRETLPAESDLVQLKDGGVRLENTGAETVRFAHFLIDTVRAT